MSGQHSGVGSMVLGLASGLSRMEGPEQYLFLAYEDEDTLLKPYMHGPCRLLSMRGTLAAPCWKQSLKSAAPWLVKAWHTLSPLMSGTTMPLPNSDGTIERAGARVMHFTSQTGFFTEVPSIYHPHDLQHLHLPQFFTPRNRIEREKRYRAFCKQASLVAVSSSWTKSDLIQNYGLEPGKIAVVPLAPLLSEYPQPSEQDLAAVRRKFQLPDAFVFYPAQTWPHKNHLRLMEALGLLAKQGLRASFVSSGNKTEYFAEIERRAQELGILERTYFLGFVSALELQCLYRLSRCVVIPTKFEAGSFPLWEAFLAGTPAACSNVTSLPKQAGDAALIFDPDNVDGIAEAIRRLWTDEALRRQLAARGRTNVARYSWVRTARIFRAHYRRLADAPLSEEDHELLAAAPLM
jgi:glycosyltransferase involved in cell wall biosynthesis